MAVHSRLLYLHALTPVHSGTGQAVGIIDLPVAREKVTGWPVIPSSTLKGVLRDASDDGQGTDQIRLAFGDTDDAGGLRFGDLHLLCLPVRSLVGTFAWVTCPLALRRFARDCRALGLESVVTYSGPEPGASEVLVAGSSKIASGGAVYLEDLRLAAGAGGDAAGALARDVAAQVFSEEDRETFLDRFAIVSGGVFDFLCETGTEVSARVRLDDNSKTVAETGLWYEEAVPAEAIFYGPVTVAAHRRGQAEKLLGQLGSQLLQIGGKASVGRGLCRLVVAA